ncbi:MAG: permease [Candidatus Promineifilaceae bacterium]
MYLNNLAALPIVSGLLAQGMHSGAAIAFLIAGPVTTIPAMTAVWGVVSRRVFALYLALGLGGAIVLGSVVNLIGL